MPRWVNWSGSVFVGLGLVLAGPQATADSEPSAPPPVKTVLSTDRLQVGATQRDASGVSGGGAAKESDGVRTGSSVGWRPGPENRTNVALDFSLHVMSAEECLAVGNLPLALDDTLSPSMCMFRRTPVTADGDAAAEPSPPSRAQVEALMRTLVAQLKVPQPEIHVGPDPSVNEWNMAVVGLPLWLWTDAPRERNTSASGGGITIDINARLDSIAYDMGDGNQVVCADWTPRPTQVSPVDAPSPTCGYTYQRPSLPRGDYTVTATARWTAHWSALGYSGSVPLSSTASRDLPVGELQAVVRR